MISPVISSNDCVSLYYQRLLILHCAGKDKLGMASTFTLGVRTFHANLSHEW